ncbi:MAG: HD domain-containing protein [Spirochaetia bacterium]|jgi:putative hydrolase of HD superfamily
MSVIENDIAFVLEVDKLKNIVRKSRNISNDRYENDAEHSWHACLMAITLQGYANSPVDIGRVLKMLVVHDLGEIGSGDIIVYNKNHADVLNELESADKLFSMLELPRHEEFNGLLREFEARETNESKYANAIDRAEPVLQNIHRKGETWKRNRIAYDRIVEMNQKKIGEGSVELWRYLIRQIAQLKENGHF